MKSESSITPLALVIETSLTEDSWEQLFDFLKSTILFTLV